MDLKTNNTQNAVVTATKQVSYSDLTYGQKQKYAIFAPHYPDIQAALDLTCLIESKGENSLKNVVDKLSLVLKADKAEARYHDALYDAFEKYTIYTFNDIIGNVCAVRMDLGLSPFTSRLKKNCEQEFFNLFIVKSEYADIDVVDEETGALKTKKSHIGYKPLFKLKPED